MAGRGDARRPRSNTAISGAGSEIMIGQGQGRRLAGLVLDLSRERADLRLVLVDESGAPALTLGPFPEEDVIATWRSLAATTGLTLMMRAWNGGTQPLACQIGRLRLGPPSTRRRFATLGQRRPRFLTRRKPGRLPTRPLIYREPELASGLER